MNDSVEIDRAEIDPKEAANLRLLRRLVTALTVVMIGGLLVLIVLFVTRFPTVSAPVSYDLPDAITLPEGVTPTAFTRGRDWVAITTPDEILIYDAQSGDLRQRIVIE
ncbi:DUF6476 family protein [Celeribacter arenosi]|uniref:Uncharacterized protein n=1 Tax=Celeribacter arenosi TaxID=792649 RepID=A0ABP7JUH4_9RHOB